MRTAPLQCFGNLISASAVLIGMALPTLLHATNGMDMEGYGPVATALGGASFAYDNGTAAVINNPATLSLMPGNARLDVAVGVLGPDISVESPSGARAKSRATAFFMPAIGYARRSGDLTYGLAVFGQGGMGTRYDGASWLGMGYGLENRTEVSVGRVIAPLSWRVSDRLSVAATVDFVWAGMDLKMAMSGAQFFDLATPASHHAGEASGTIVQDFGRILQQMPAGTAVDYAYFDFCNGNNFTGAAKGYGYAGKVGLVYRITPELAFGLTYHSETELSSLKAPASSLSFQLDVPGMGRLPQALTGSTRVRDFEWPAMLGAGINWKPAGRWSVAADVREVFWSGVMDAFRMSFAASNDAANGDFAGQGLDAELYQRWHDQTIFECGASYAANRSLTLRGGVNVGNDPIPDEFLNPLFPATIERHLTGGFSYRIGAHSTIDGSVTYGFKESRTNGAGIIVNHEQVNSQLMFSRLF